MRMTLIRADARRIPLADRSVHCVVTSPPYLGLRDYGVPGQIGLEETPEAFVETMRAVFAEVWRVLRDDGTLWLNLGDSYNPYNGGAGPSSSLSQTQSRERPQLATGYGLKVKTLKPKDLMGIPWRVALALQADGWYLRSDIIWAKPSPMPESVVDRPTKAHEYLFLLTKQERYFYDADAVREPPKSQDPRVRRSSDDLGGEGIRNTDLERYGTTRGLVNQPCSHPAGANLRTVWRIPSDPFPGAHFATFPRRLVEPCVKAGTSERGCCPACGSSWRRKTERTAMVVARSGRRDAMGEKGRTQTGGTMVAPPTSRTVGWEPSCDCPAAEPVPCTVFDPFNGAGTTGVVASALGRGYIGTDINPDYLALARRRIERPHAPIDRPGEDSPLPLFPSDTACA